MSDEKMKKEGKGKACNATCPYASSSSSKAQDEKTPANSATTTTTSSSSSYASFLPAPRNNEYPPNQMPNPSQTKPLSKVRLYSTIPKTTDDAVASESTCRPGSACPAASRVSGEDSGDSSSQPPNTWVYPSEQMFFNALKRKGYTHIQEEDMKAVVAIHNTVNERAWKQVMEWECTLHPDTCQFVKLAYFKGKPKELSPKARFKHWIGYTLPFDRHDWTVERRQKEGGNAENQGTLVRYVIDFYSGRSVPGMPASVYIDTRPALDSPTAVFDRVRMYVRKKFGMGMCAPPRQGESFSAAPSDGSREDGGGSAA